MFAVRVHCNINIYTIHGAKVRELQKLHKKIVILIRLLHEHACIYALIHCNTNYYTVRETEVRELQKSHKLRSNLPVSTRNIFTL